MVMIDVDMSWGDCNQTYSYDMDTGCILWIITTEYDELHTLPPLMTIYTPTQWADR